MENTLFPNIPIKNFSIDNKNQTPPSCYICGMTVGRMPYTCPMCNRVVGMNCHSDIFLPSYIGNQIWKKPYVNKRVCTNCIQDTIRVNQASENKARKIFAEIFLPDDTDEILSDQTQEETPIEEKTTQEPTENVEDIEDKFIGGILDSLAIHNNIVFDDTGKLDPKSWSLILNSFNQYLKYPDLG